MIDTKTIATGVITAVATALVMSVVGFFMGIFERGTTAITEDQIEAVIERVLVTDSGKTHAAALADINLSLTGMEATMNTRFDAVENRVGTLDEAIRELAR